jgi:hypothetical protein
MKECECLFLMKLRMKFATNFLKIPVNNQKAHNYFQKHKKINQKSHLQSIDQ